MNGEVGEEDENAFDEFLSFRFGQASEDDNEDVFEIIAQLGLRKTQNQRFQDRETFLIVNFRLRHQPLKDAEDRRLISKGHEQSSVNQRTTHQFLQNDRFAGLFDEGLQQSREGRNVSTSVPEGRR